MQEDQPEWLKNVKTFRLCPICKSGELSSRVPQSFYYKYMVFWASYKRYKCEHCNKLVHIRQ